MVAALNYIIVRTVLTIADDINLNRMVIQVTLVIFGPVGFLAEVQLCHLYLHEEYLPLSHRNVAFSKGHNDGCSTIREAGAKRKTQNRQTTRHFMFYSEPNSNTYVPNLHR